MEIEEREGKESEIPLAGQKGKRMEACAVIVRLEFLIGDYSDVYAALGWGGGLH